MRTMNNARHLVAQSRGLGCCCLLTLGVAASPAFAQFADNCESAPTLGEGVYGFDLLNATAGPTPFVPSCAQGRPATLDQWVRFVPTVSGPVEFSTLGLTTGDTVISVHEDNCEFAPFLVNGCSDDADGTTQSRVVLMVEAGQAMLVRIASGDGSRPSGSLRIAPFTPVVGDACDNPLAAATGVNDYDTSLAVVNSFEGCFGFRDMFYTYTPATSGALTIQSCDAEFPPSFTVLSACGGSTLACSKFGECFAGLAVQAGVPIVIRVTDDFGAGAGQFTISVDPNGIPVNDTCGGALPALLGNTPFDNTFATTDTSQPCGSGPFTFDGGLDLYYTFTPAVSGTYDISTELSEGLSDTQLAISDSCFDPPFVCNDDARGFLSFIRTELVAGNPYIIRVAGSGLPNNGTPIDRGQGVLSIRQSIAPGNDLCDNAQTVGPGLHAYNIYDASSGDQDASCLPEFVTTSNDVWFRYVPAANGPVEASLEAGGDAGSLSLFNDCEDLTSALTSGTYFDPSTGSLTSRMVVNGVAGVPLLFRVAYAQFIGDPQFPTGAGEVYIGPARLVPPINDNCSSPLPLAQGETFVDLTNSIKDCNGAATPQNNACVPVSDNDVFYRYTASASETVTIAINDGVSYPEFAGLVVSVLNSCDGEPIACSFILGDAPADTVQFAATAGQEYIVRVASVLSFGSSQVFTGSIIVGSGVSCTADFDGDGDTGTDADIEAFFACLAGTCCATCQTADFDGDGDTGTDADIEAFFRVLAGGNC